jgi:hypothetical protein
MPHPAMLDAGGKPMAKFFSAKRHPTKLATDPKPRYHKIPLPNLQILLLLSAGVPFIPSAFRYPVKKL